MDMLFISSLDKLRLMLRKTTSHVHNRWVIQYCPAKSATLMHVRKSLIRERHRSVRRSVSYAFLRTTLVRALTVSDLMTSSAYNITNTIFDFGYAQNYVICGHPFAYCKWQDAKKRCTFRRTVLYGKKLTFFKFSQS